MPKENELTTEDTAELQRLYAELPAAIADAAEALQSELSGEAVAKLLEDDEKVVDTIIRRICQLTAPKEN
jgi:hypothetical protein